jgi:hypothetical protein
MSATYKRKRLILSVWLHDRFDDIDPEGARKRYTDAADLLKWLTANGFKLVEEDS